VSEYCSANVWLNPDPELEIQQQLVMFRAVRDRVLSAIRAGKTLEEVVASKPTADFDQSRMGGAITNDRFVTLVYTDLSRRAK